MKASAKIPAQNLFTFRCMECGKELRAYVHFQGKLGRCKYCGKRFVVPNPQDNGPPVSSRDGKSIEATSPADFNFSAAAEAKPVESNPQRIVICRPRYRLWVYGSAAGVFLALITLGVFLALPKAQEQTTLSAVSESFIGTEKSSTEEHLVGSETPSHVPKPIEMKGEPKSNSKPEKSPPVSSQPETGKTSTASQQAIVPKASSSAQQAAPLANSAVPADVAKALKISDDILEKIKRATAFIEGRNRTGTAFVVAPGILVTNNHVLQDEYIDNLRIRFVSKDNLRAESLAVKLLYRNRRRDLAILAAPIPTTQAPLQLKASEREITKGLPIVVIGHPGRFKGAITEIHAVTQGVVEGPVMSEGETWYHLKAEAAPGNSGGPVVDGNTGEVIGIVTAILFDRGNQRGTEPFRGERQMPRPAGHTDTSPDSMCIPSVFIRDAVAEVETAPDREKLIELATARYAAEMVTLQICAAHLLSFEAAEANITFRVRKGALNEQAKIEQYKIMHEALMDALKPAIKKVQSTPHLPLALRNQVLLFVENYHETKRQAVNLNVMYHTQYLNRYNAQVKKHEKIQKDLFKLLEIPDRVEIHLLQ